MRPNAIVMMGAALAFGASLAQAQTGEVPPRPPVASRYLDSTAGISLADAIALATKQEPSLRAARSDIDAAVGRRQQAALRANPTATFERRQEPGGTDNQTSIGMQLPLELFRRAARITTAEREADVSRYDVADRERRLAGDVRTRYGDVLAAIRELEVLDQLLLVTERQLELVAARVTEGAAPALDRDLLDVEVRRLAADRRLQVGRVDAALIALKRIVGLPPDATMALRETLEGVVILESATPATPVGDADTTVRSRPDVLMAEARIATADARTQQSSAEGRVDMSVYGTYMRMDAGFPQMGVTSVGALERVRGMFNYATAGVTLTIPLLNRNQGAVTAARAEREGAVAARDATVLQAQADLAVARIDDASAREAVALYREGAQRLARQNLTVVGQTFELGRATVFDLLAEQRRYLEIEKSYTAALRSAFEARTRLQLAIGDLR